MKLCADKAMTRSDEVNCLAPEEVQQMKKTIESMRAKAEECKNLSVDVPGVPKEVAVAAAVPGGGMFGALAKGVQAAANVAQAAADATVGGIGAVMEKAITTAADGCDQAVQKLEKPFQTVGKDIVGEKKESLTKALQMFIGNAALVQSGDACNMVRGAEPYGPKEYAEAPQD